MFGGVVFICEKIHDQYSMIFTAVETSRLFGRNSLANKEFTNLAKSRVICLQSLPELPILNTA